MKFWFVHTVFVLCCAYFMRFKFVNKFVIINFIIIKVVNLNITLCNSWVDQIIDESSYFAIFMRVSGKIEPVKKIVRGLWQIFFKHIPQIIFTRIPQTLSCWRLNHWHQFWLDQYNAVITFNLRSSVVCFNPNIFSELLIKFR